ncbi:hypothetical protein [Listeria monocytogenes]|uniref:hypothetical protein n=1 Tax=Listeria monocytogenes TaxID=1639 RepID=UPI001359B221|nr:hypothetical protein [Listeria monocytogenes]EDO1253749.1 hypothetical protein [Listeria monocytogenes]EFR8989463.1 hypothetical protein [Listeria monocytogenes]EIS8279044.1 hypothetical protein [Listeria monocytogenes]EIU5789459.1 hypothetical protein [Listeria monocytogenes]EKZ4888689.1 hypothetical protein [Listeria monocytogenes]
MNKIKQKIIEDTEYWDARVFDLKTLYFGDEVHVVLEEQVLIKNFRSNIKVTV